MPDQPTPKPLTWDEVDDAVTAEYAYTDKTIRRLWEELLASRAESAALRAAVAEAEKERDEANKPWNFRLMLPDPVDTYDAVDCRLVDTGHSDRLLILESGELNERLEDLTASRDALAAELAEARKYGAPVAGAKALGFVKHTCSHDEYWTTASGACMACRADKAEAALAARDAAGKASGGGADAR